MFLALQVQPHPSDRQLRDNRLCWADIELGTERAEMKRRAGALLPVGARAEGQLAERRRPHLVMLEIQEVLEVSYRRLISEVEVDGVRKVAGARHALEEGGDGHGLDADHVGRRRHREEPLRVAARRRVASPLGVYHRHALFGGDQRSDPCCLEPLLRHQLGIEHVEGLRHLELVFGLAAEGRHGAGPGEELVPEPVQMLLDLRRRQRRRAVLLDVDHVLPAHAQPHHHVRPVLVDEPGDGGGVPGGRGVAEDAVGERERAAVQAEVEEGDEVAVHGEAFRGGRVLRPGAAVQVEAGVEQTRRDLPFHRAPLVEQLRHLVELEHAGLDPDAVALAALNVDGHAADGPDAGHGERRRLDAAPVDEAPAGVLTVLEPHVAGHVEAPAEAPHRLLGRRHGHRRARL